mmetsp:Transcript_30103/g.103557  ORF Transcript_30103/g.103557 Transcript_30103/m.103557 type:complete len:239 (-) Transcript_30103:143-859(-)
MTAPSITVGKTQRTAETEPRGFRGERAPESPWSWLETTRRDCPHKSTTSRRPTRSSKPSTRRRRPPPSRTRPHAHRRAHARGATTARKVARACQPPTKTKTKRARARASHSSKPSTPTRPGACGSSSTHQTPPTLTSTKARTLTRNKPSKATAALRNPVSPGATLKMATLCGTSSTVQPECGTCGSCSEPTRPATERPRRLAPRPPRGPRGPTHSVARRPPGASAGSGGPQGTLGSPP